MNPNASTSNKQKRKNQNFMMVKHKVQKKKVKRSFKDKQVNVLTKITGWFGLGLWYLMPLLTIFQLYLGRENRSIWRKSM